MKAPKYAVIAAGRSAGAPSSLAPSANARAWKASTASLLGAGKYACQDCRLARDEADC